MHFGQIELASLGQEGGRWENEEGEPYGEGAMRICDKLGKWIELLTGWVMTEKVVKLVMVFIVDERCLGFFLCF